MEVVLHQNADSVLCRQNSNHHFLCATQEGKIWYDNVIFRDNDFIFFFSSSSASPFSFSICLVRPSSARNLVLVCAHVPTLRLRTFSFPCAFFLVITGVRQYSAMNGNSFGFCCGTRLHTITMPFNQQDIYLVTFLSAFSISSPHFKKRLDRSLGPAASFVWVFSALTFHSSGSLWQWTMEFIGHYPCSAFALYKTLTNRWAETAAKRKTYINFFDMHIQVLCWCRVFCGCRCCSSILSYTIFFSACLGIFFLFASFFLFFFVPFIRFSVRSFISPTLLTLSFMLYPCISTFSPFHGNASSTNVYYES